LRAEVLEWQEAAQEAKSKAEKLQIKLEEEQ